MQQHFSDICTHFLDYYKLFIDTLQELADDPTLKLPSSNASRSLKSVEAMLCWCKSSQNKLVTTTFAQSLCSSLENCMQPGVSSHAVPAILHEKMMGFYYQLRLVSHFFLIGKNSQRMLQVKLHT